MNWLTSLFSTGATTLVDTIGKAFDNNFTTKEEREAAKIELLKEVNRNLENLETIALETYKAEIADRESARKREVELAKATGHADYLQWFLAVFAMAVFGYMVYSVINGLVSKENEGLAHNIMGLMEGIVLSIFGYFFGSSVSSKLKDMRQKS